MEHSRAVLSNGLPVLHAELAAVHSVTLAVFVGVGSRFEPRKDAGVSHLIEHMLFKGTQRRPTSAVISQTLDSVGGVLNASTDKEVTVYWAKVARDHASLAVDLLADMLQCSRFRPRDLAREKSVILEELYMIHDDPQDWAHVLLDDLLWPDQAVGREVAGTAESVRAIRHDAMLAHFHRYYGANNAVIAIVGAIDRADALDLVGSQFGAWPAADPVAPKPALISTAPGSLIVDERPNEQVNLCLGFPGASREHPDRWALDIMTLILGGGTSSRLFLKVRDALGLAYDVHAYTTHLSDTGSVVVYAGGRADRAERLLAQIGHEIARLRNRRVSSVELDRAKQYYRGRLWLDLEDTFAIASWFASQEMLQHEVFAPETVVNSVAAVTADDILRVARTYLSPECAALSAVGPVSSSQLSAWIGGA